MNSNFSMLQQTYLMKFGYLPQSGLETGNLRTDDQLRDAIKNLQVSCYKFFPLWRSPFNRQGKNGICRGEKMVSETFSGVGCQKTTTYYEKKNKSTKSKSIDRTGLGWNNTVCLLKVVLLRLRDVSDPFALQLSVGSCCDLISCDSLINVECMSR